MDIHYTSHRGALTINYASSHFRESQYRDKFANKVYSWLGKSTKINTKLKELMESVLISKLNILQIHQNKWLLGGNIIERLVKCLPTSLKD